MARGHQKEQSKQKNAKKSEAMAKQKGHSAADQKKAAAAALTFSCSVCRVSLPVILSLTCLTQLNTIELGMLI